MKFILDHSNLQYILQNFQIIAIFAFLKKKEPDTEIIPILIPGYFGEVRIPIK